MANYARAFCLCGLLCFIVSPVTQGSTTLQSAYDLYDFLFSNYTVDLRPVESNNHMTYITIGGFLIMIQDLNEVTSQLTVSMSLYIAWFDVKLQWNPADYEGRYTIMVDAEKIWTPGLYLISQTQQGDRLGTGGVKATVTSSGLVYLTVFTVFNSVCAVDITYYPFDEQVCDLIISNYDYPYVFRYTPVNSTLDLSYFYENGLWSLEGTSMFVRTLNEGVTHDVIVRLILKRRAMYPILNTLVPIIMLMLLNCAVFLLPSESGERLGFAVTILLSIAVYMTIISDELPKTSKPTALLVYVLVAYLAQSALLCIATIFSLRLYFKQSEKVSKGWCVFVQVVKCYSCKRKKPQNVYKIGENDTSENSKEHTETPSVTAKSGDITWKTVSEAYDNFIFVISILVLLAIVITYTVFIATTRKWADNV